MIMNEWENDDSDCLLALQSVYKEFGQFFFHTYLLNCIKKDISILLKVYAYLHDPLNKVKKFQKKKNTNHTPSHT